MDGGSAFTGLQVKNTFLHIDCSQSSLPKDSGYESGNSWVVNGSAHQWRRQVSEPAPNLQRRMTPPNASKPVAYDDWSEEEFSYDTFSGSSEAGSGHRETAKGVLSPQPHSELNGADAAAGASLQKISGAERLSWLEMEESAEDEGLSTDFSKQTTGGTDDDSFCQQQADNAWQWLPQEMQEAAWSMSPECHMVMDQAGNPQMAWVIPVPMMMQNQGSGSSPPQKDADSSSNGFVQKRQQNPYRRKARSLITIAKQAQQRKKDLEEKRAEQTPQQTLLAEDAAAPVTSWADVADTTDSAPAKSETTPDSTDDRGAEKEAVKEKPSSQKEKEDAPRSIFFCPYCGGRCQPHFKFCTYCAARLPQ